MAEPTPQQVKSRLNSVKVAAGVLTALAAAIATVLFNAGSPAAAIFTVGFGVVSVILVAVTSLAIRDISAGVGKFWQVVVKVLVVFILLYFGTISVALGPAIVKAIRGFVDPPVPKEGGKELAGFPAIQRVEAHSLPNGGLQISGVIPQGGIKFEGSIRALGYTGADMNDQFPAEARPSVSSETGAIIFEFDNRKQFNDKVFVRIFVEKDGKDIAASTLQQIKIQD